MSTQVLNGLRDYLTGTLSIDNMLWLSAQLAEYAKKKEEAQLKRYTMDEINAMLDDAEAEIAAGIGIDDEVLRKEDEEEYERELADEAAQTK